VPDLFAVLFCRHGWLIFSASPSGKKYQCCNDESKLFISPLKRQVKSVG
jgi:hypothetical protein